MTPGRDRVRLDVLSGYEFEKFCAMVFDRLGYGRIENLPSVGDKGRDLIIHGERKIVVECKHQPKTAVGRPVIQKLHSAVVSERADGGWVVTTGGFTRQAREHAEEIQESGIELKLIDRVMLLDLADQAGIEILGRVDKPIMVVESPAPDQLIQAVADAFLPRLTREPKSVRLAECLSIRDVTVVPVLSATYDVHQDWHTGTGFRKRLLHSVHLTDQSLIVNAHTREPVEDQVASFLRRAPQVANTEDTLSLAPNMVDRLSTETTMHDVRDKVRWAVRFDHSVRLLHEANGRRYWRDCRVSDGNIFIRNVTQILLAYWHLHCKIQARLTRSRVSRTQKACS